MKKILVTENQYRRIVQIELLESISLEELANLPIKKHTILEQVDLDNKLELKDVKPKYEIIDSIRVVLKKFLTKYINENILTNELLTSELSNEDKEIAKTGLKNLYDKYKDNPTKALAIFSRLGSKIPKNIYQLLFDVIRYQLYKTVDYSNLVFLDSERLLSGHRPGMDSQFYNHYFSQTYGSLLADFIRFVISNVQPKIRNNEIQLETTVNADLEKIFKALDERLDKDFLSGNPPKIVILTNAEFESILNSMTMKNQELDKRFLNAPKTSEIKSVAKERGGFVQTLAKNMLQILDK